MFNTGLTEQEKESLIKYLCISGELIMNDDGHKMFVFYGPIDVEDKFTAGHLLKKAFDNIFNQIIK